MKTYLLLGFLLGLSLSTFAQNQAYAPALARSFGGRDLYSTNDNDPEDKDISIMTGILSKLVQQEFNNGDTAINIERVRGSYIPGSGILFTVTQRMPFYSRPMLLGVNGRAAFPNRYGLTTAGGQATDVVVLEAPRATGTTRAKPRATEQPGSSSGGQQPTYALVVPDATTIYGDSVTLQYNKGLLQQYTTNGWVEFNSTNRGNSSKIQDSVFAAKIPRMKKVLEKFLAEYTILLGKLKPEEKIWVTWSIKEDYWGIDQGKMACELSSRIVKQDMLDLRAGKLDQAKFAEKIQYSITRCATQQQSNPELEVFSAILQRLYSAEVSQNLVQYGSQTADVIGGFGYVFKLNLMPAIGLNEVQLDRIPGVYRVNPQKKEISKEEVDNKVKAFKAEFPGQLLEYGRIIKGLKVGEILKIDVSIGNSVGILWDASAGGIKQLSYTVPQSLIRDYDSGKLKLEDAVKLIQVEEK
ncbi:MAG: hypothetical protein SFV55_13005 [Haliscomenobacter sp.]|uniref:hypothetical protein n=1 Tax=Haliscomenobacter sp. TaxID=2717303 RepID=UPI0029BCC59B|nr:hypothetical protein [Haliscomenobacter sp.]MDX2069337.1 hypothetical protein [Haliscomenobacter sp.]